MRKAFVASALLAIALAGGSGHGQVKVQGHQPGDFERLAQEYRDAVAALRTVYRSLESGREKAVAATKAWDEANKPVAAPVGDPPATFTFTYSGNGSDTCADEKTLAELKAILDRLTPKGKVK